MSDIFVVKAGRDYDTSLVGAFSHKKDAYRCAFEMIVEMIEAWDGDEDWMPDFTEELNHAAALDKWNEVVYKESLDDSMYVSVVSVPLNPGIED